MVSASRAIAPARPYSSRAGFWAMAKG